MKLSAWGLGSWPRMCEQGFHLTGLGRLLFFGKLWGRWGDVGAGGHFGIVFQLQLAHLCRVSPIKPGCRFKDWQAAWSLSHYWACSLLWFKRYFLDFSMLFKVTVVCSQILIFIFASFNIFFIIALDHCFRVIGFLIFCLRLLDVL